MSSAVNKTSTRFVPKAPGRGAGRRGSNRLSAVSTAFGVPLTGGPQTGPQPTQPAKRKVTFAEDVIDEDYIESLASKDADIVMLSEDTGSTGEKVAAPHVSVPVSEPKTNRVSQAALQTLPTDLSTPRSPFSYPARLAKISDRPSLRPKRARKFSESSAETIQRPDRQVGRADNNSSTASWGSSPSNGADPEPETPDENATRGPQFDEEGRQVIEPEDLKEIGRRRALKDAGLENKVINVKTFTMASLCRDIPIGETNEDYLRFENARTDRRRKRARLLQAKQMMRGKFEPKTAELRAELVAIYNEYCEEREERFGKIHDDAVKAREQMAADGEAVPSVKLQIGKDGSINIDTESQTLDRHAHNRADEVAQNAKEIDQYATVINSYSFSTKERPERWSEQETAKFYHALSVWGTDFNLIAQMFPNRTRHQIKTKFKYEERRNEDKVQLYLVHRRRVDLTDYAKLSGTMIVDVDEVNKELQVIRDEHEKELQRAKKLKEAATREDRDQGGSQPRRVKLERV